MSNYITIPNFEQLTRQQMFDMAAKHIMSTGVPSVVQRADSQWTCCYRGTGCNAAPFLQRDLLAEKHEINWYAMTVHKFAPEYEVFFVRGLQAVHDSAADLAILGKTDPNFMAKYIKGMLHFANHHGLNAGVLGVS